MLNPVQRHMCCWPKEGKKNTFNPVKAYNAGDSPFTPEGERPPASEAVLLELVVCDILRSPVDTLVDLEKCLPLTAINRVEPAHRDDSI